mgnify:CR=1 FL=1
MANDAQMFKLCHVRPKRDLCQHELFSHGGGSLIDDNKKNIDIGIKKLTELVEYVYKESIRGWNSEQNLYILQIDKLKEIDNSKYKL